MNVQSILDKLIEKLLASDPTASSAIDENDINIEVSGTIGRPPLMAVASEGLTESFEMLISKGALVNTRGKGCMTALHEASSNGHVEIARRLISLGADVDAETIDGVTPLMCAAACKSAGQARFAEDRSSSKKPKLPQGKPAGFFVPCNA